MTEKLKQLNRLIKNDILKNNILLYSHRSFKYDEFQHKIEEFIKRESLHKNLSNEFQITVDNLIEFCQSKKGSLSNEVSEFIDLANILLEAFENLEKSSIEDQIFEKFLSLRSDLKNYIIKGVLYQKQDFDFGIKINGDLVAVCEMKKITGAQNLLMMTLEDRYKLVDFANLEFILMVDDGNQLNYYKYENKKFKKMEKFPSLDELSKTDDLGMSDNIESLLKLTNNLINTIKTKADTVKEYFGANTFENQSDNSIRNYEETLNRLRLLDELYSEVLKYNIRQDSSSKLIENIEKLNSSITIIIDYLSKDQEEQKKSNIVAQEVLIYKNIDEILDELFFNQCDLLSETEHYKFLAKLYESLKKLHSNSFSKYIISFQSDEKLKSMQQLSSKLDEEKASITGNMGIKTIENIKNEFKELKDRYHDDALLYLAGFLITVTIGLFVVYAQINYFDSLKSVKNLNYIFIAPKITISILYFVLVFFLLKGYNTSIHLKKVYEHKEMLAKVFENIYDVQARLDIDDSKNQTIKEYFYKNIAESYVRFDDTGHINSSANSNMSFDFSKVLEK